MKNVVAIIVIFGLGWYANQRYQAYEQDIEVAQKSPPDAMNEEEIPKSPKRKQKFMCDGREYCSQMTSCAEAEFFLENCPNTKMDGNNDGEPCERQWCK